MYYRTRRILSNIISGILSFLIVVIGFFSILVVTLNIVYIKTSVEGFSMVPTFNLNVATSHDSGDVIYINRFKNYGVGDVVVAELGDKYIIKRLVGCPGDIIQIKDEGETYGLYVNNSLLYSKEKTDGDGAKIGSTNSYYLQYLHFLNNDNKDIDYIKLGEDEYFLMGDNWGKTSDSLTSNGPFSKSDIVGKVEIVVPYGEKEDIYILKTIYKMLFN